MKLSPEKRIRMWMIRNDVSVGDLARKVGAKPSHLSNILAGRRGANEDVSNRLVKITGVRLPMDKARRRPQDSRSEVMME